jgi:predicted Zn-ribbon and HTH transcriptional regulator
METYPRNRCPECRSFFRSEVLLPPLTTEEPFDPSFAVCPHCGFKFHRFHLPARKEKLEQPIAP